MTFYKGPNGDLKIRQFLEKVIDERDIFILRMHEKLSGFNYLRVLVL